MYDPPLYPGHHYVVEMGGWRASLAATGVDGDAIVQAAVLCRAVVVGASEGTLYLSKLLKARLGAMHTFEAWYWSHADSDLVRLFLCGPAQ